MKIGDIVKVMGISLKCNRITVTSSLIECVCQTC